MGRCLHPGRLRVRNSSVKLWCKALACLVCTRKRKENKSWHIRWKAAQMNGSLSTRCWHKHLKNMLYGEKLHPFPPPLRVHVDITSKTYQYFKCTVKGGNNKCSFEEIIPPSFCQTLWLWDSAFRWLKYSLHKQWGFSQALAVLLICFLLSFWASMLIYFVAAQKKSCLCFYILHVFFEFHHTSNAVIHTE